MANLSQDEQAGAEEARPTRKPETANVLRSEGVKQSRRERGLKMYLVAITPVTRLAARWLSRDRWTR